MKVLASVHFQFTHVVDCSDSAAATILRLEHQNLLCCFYASSLPHSQLPSSFPHSSSLHSTSFSEHQHSAPGHGCAETHCYPEVKNNPQNTFCSPFLNHYTQSMKGIELSKRHVEFSKSVFSLVHFRFLIKLPVFPIALKMHKILISQFF